MSFEKTSRNFGSGVATHDLLASWSGYTGVYYNGGYGRVKIKRNGLDADPYGTYQEVLDRSVYGNTYWRISKPSATEPHNKPHKVFANSSTFLVSNSTL